MKLCFNSFILFLCLISWPVLTEEINKDYTVKLGGIKIGELNWQINMNNEKYINKLRLNSRGVLSALYSFKGEYLSEGRVYQKNLIPKKYNHLWQTKKNTKNFIANVN